MTKNQRQVDQTAADRAHELCVFLGGDDTALRISRALRFHGYISSVVVLRDEYARSTPAGLYLTDIRGIGAKTLELIKEKIEG